MSNEPLLEAAGLDLCRKNAFRVTGLPTTCSAREVTRFKERFKQQVSLGDDTPIVKPLLNLTPNPTPDEIQEAIQRLGTPEKRLVDEFFWFWPEKDCSWNDDAAIQALCLPDLQKALAIWQEKSKHSWVAYHNLAVYYLAEALQCDSSYLSSRAGFSPEKIDVFEWAWRKADQLWGTIWEKEDLFRLFNDRITYVDDSRIEDTFAWQIQESLPSFVALLHAKLMKAHAEKKGYTAVFAHRQLLERLPCDPEIRSQALASVAGPAKQELFGICDKAEQDAANSSILALKITVDLIEDCRGNLKLMESLLGKEHPLYQASADKVAMTGLRNLIRHVNPDGQWQTIKEILTALHQTAGSESAKGEIHSYLQTAKSKIDDEMLGPLFQMCQKVNMDCEERVKKYSIPKHFSEYNLGREYLAAAKELRKTAFPLLLSLAGRYGETSDTYKTATGIYCMALRSIAVDLSNRAKLFSDSRALLEEAMEICLHEDTKRKLEADHSVVKNMWSSSGARDVDYYVDMLFHYIGSFARWTFSPNRRWVTLGIIFLSLAGLGVYLSPTGRDSGTNRTLNQSVQSQSRPAAQTTSRSIAGSTPSRPAVAQQPNSITKQDPWAGFVDTPAPDLRTQQRNHNPQPPPGYTLDPPKPKGTESSPTVGPSTEPRFLADEDVEVVSPTTSERSANAVRIQQLKQEIEDGKSRLESLEHRLKLLEIDHDSQKSSLNYLKSRIDSIESDANAGLSYDEYDYKNKIDEYNSKLRSLRSASTDYDILYGQYESLLNIVNGNVRTYNNLIGASR